MRKSSQFLEKVYGDKNINLLWVHDQFVIELPKNCCFSHALPRINQTIFPQNPSNRPGHYRIPWIWRSDWYGPKILLGFWHDLDLFQDFLWEKSSQPSERVLGRKTLTPRGWLEGITAKGESMGALSSWGNHNHNFSAPSIAFPHNKSHDPQAEVDEITILTRECKMKSGKGSLSHFGCYP